VTDEQDFLAALDRFTNPRLSLLNDSEKLFTQHDSTPIHRCMRLDTKDGFSLEPLINSILKDLLDNRHMVSVFHRLGQAQVVISKLRLDLKLAQVVEVIFIKFAVVDRLEAKSLNNFLLAFTFQISDQHGNVSV